MSSWTDAKRRAPIPQTVRTLAALSDCVVCPAPFGRVVKEGSWSRCPLTEVPGKLGDHPSENAYGRCEDVDSQCCAGKHERCFSTNMEGEGRIEGPACACFCHADWYKNGTWKEGK